MSTPNKRRKKNDFQTSNQPIRSLDFFFGKKQDAKVKTEQEHELGNNTLSDEQYARKLQAELDAQDQAAERARAETPVVVKDESASPSKKVEEVGTDTNDHDKAEEEQERE